MGTAYSVSSRLWYTIANGINTEVYYPSIDTPQIRDLQFLISDEETFFHGERRNTLSEIELIDPNALGFKITNRDPEGRYTIEKQIIGDPHLTCLLVHTKFDVVPEWRGRLHLYVLCAPHLGIGGWHNNGEIVEAKGRRFLLAYRDNTYLALGAPPRSRSFLADTWHQRRLDRSGPQPENGLGVRLPTDGNLALTGEIDLTHGYEFTLGLSFGRSRHAVGAGLFQSLCIPFATNVKSFVDQWSRTRKRLAVDRHEPG